MVKFGVASTFGSWIGVAEASATGELVINVIHVSSKNLWMF